jgi:hypothetical protein
MKDKSIAGAQGIRVATHPILRKIDEYMVERKNLEIDLLSLDNNVYRTAILRELGWHGDHSVIIMRKLEEKGMKWIVDKNVISDNIKTSSLSSYKARLQDANNI